MKIKVKTLNSQTKEFVVEPDITIRQFKEIISPQISIESDVIRLIFKGRVLDDAAILNSCDIDNATIHAVERLPPNPTDHEPPSTRSEPNSRTSANAEIILGPVSTLDENYPNLAEFITQIVHSIAPNSGTSNQYSEFSNRLLLADRFLDHIEQIYRNRFTNYTTITPEIRNYAAELRPPPTTTPSDTTPSEESVVIRFSRVLRRYLNVINTTSPMINAYIYFLESSSNAQSGESMPNFASLYPEFTDATSNALHSLAHALHTLSDVLVYSSNTNSEAPTSAPFSLVVPRLASDMVTTYHRHSDSRDPAAPSNAPPPTNSAPQTVTSSATNTQPSSIETSTSDSSSSVHVTVEVTSIFDSAGSRSTSNNNPAQYSAAAPSNPTATANNSSSVPLLIRTTAGGGNSNSVRNPNTTTTSTARANPRVGRVNLRSSGSNTRRVRLVGDYTPPGPNDMPFDPYLSCHSVHNTGSTSTRILQFGPISLNAVADPPQSSAANAPTSIQPNTDNNTPNSLSTAGASANASNPDIISSRNRVTRHFVSPRAARRFLSPRVIAQRVVTPTTTTATTTVNQTPQPVPPTNSHTIENWSSAFPIDVVPVIQADVNSQTSVRKQPPFSDGYICGTTGKKKKLSEQGNAVQFINTSLSDAFVNNLNSSTFQADSEEIRSAIENDQELTHAYEENINVTLQENVKKYKKIDPKKYPKAHELSNKK